PVCLTDDQLTAELRGFIAANGLPSGLARQYFLFTPPEVGSCFDASSNPCVYQDYCAYHSFFSSFGPVLYAVHPYVAGVPSCDTGQSPTGTGADAVLNVVSHEHNEIITDPTGRGWFDSAGDENGDKCAWTFASYRWSFGDGAHGRGRLASHGFAHAGSYRVKLTVTDDEGSAAARAVTVEVARRPRRR